MRPRIFVIGSANMDMIIRTERIPKAGETVLGENFIQSSGGKGANQAIAAARLGAEVAFVARLGRDSFGKEAIKAYEKEGINTKYIVWDEEAPSGVALIMINKEGEDIICVDPGANGKLSIEDILRAEEAIKSADCMLLQLEIPIKTVEYAIRLAKKYHVRVVLNPAPMTKLPESLLKMVDILTPNETEAATIMGDYVPFPGDLALMVKRKFSIKNVVVTMGKEGAAISSELRPNSVVVRTFPVRSLDSTGAGDAFNGGLAVALARGDELEEAVRYANVVGALATTRFGAQCSLPTALEVGAFLNQIAEKIKG
ncbi:MAG: ribokinase [Anaerolineales bacterium]|jgi:ribokinase